MNGGCGVIGDPWLAEDCESLYGYMCRYTEGINFEAVQTSKQFEILRPEQSVH